VQTGSSSKIFTLITALKQGVPFGHQISIQNPETIGPFYNCQGNWVGPKEFQNAEAQFQGTETYMLSEATVESVNTYFVNLEKQVGLCNVVQTAASMGLTRADGTNLLQYDPKLGRQAGLSADNIASFTLGAVGVSPMGMAAAYATVAAGGMYCSPQAISKIEVMSSGKQLPVKSANCHQAIPAGVAAAANYILQQVFGGSGTADGRNTTGHYAAAKTGTADGGYYAAFAGWTPTLAAYVSVFNPIDPTTPAGAMVGAHSCYVDLYGENCPGQMFGDNAPGATWEETFNHADLGQDVPFPGAPGSFFSQGDGFGAPTSDCNPPSNGGPNPTPSPNPSCSSGTKRKPPAVPPTPNPSP
jgi:membrane peptidoglycan carboxypeptidase